MLPAGIGEWVLSGVEYVHSIDMRQNRDACSIIVWFFVLFFFKDSGTSICERHGRVYEKELLIEEP